MEHLIEIISLIWLLYQPPFFWVQIAQKTLDNLNIIIQSKNSMTVFGKSTKVLGDFSSYNRRVQVPWRVQSGIFYDVVDGTV